MKQIKIFITTLIILINIFPIVAQDNDPPVFIGFEIENDTVLNCNRQNLI